jgi:hypothetical protein
MSAVQEAVRLALQHIMLASVLTVCIGSPVLVQQCCAVLCSAVHAMPVVAAPAGVPVAVRCRTADASISCVVASQSSGTQLMFSL